jgi:hypothetical protein
MCSPALRIGSWLNLFALRLLVCAVLSVPLSTALAVACTSAQICPAGWMELGVLFRFGDLDSNYRPTRLPAVPIDATVLAHCGVGTTRLDIRWSQLESKGGPSGQCRLTMSGWPQVIAVSSRSSVELPQGSSRGETLQPGPSSESMSVLDSSWTEIQWTGGAFNVATGTLLLTALSTWIPRVGADVSTRNRLILTVMAVAWVVALALPTWRLMRAESAGPGLPSLELAVFASPGEFASPETRHLFTSDGRDSTYYRADERSDFAVTWRRQRLLLPTGDGSFARTVRAGMSCSAGWPWRAFVMGDDNAIVIPVVDLSQLQVRWVPWIANVLAISALISSVFLPRYLIRRARRRRGQCRECGYPIGAGPTCPECGAHTSHVRLDAAGVRAVGLPPDS